MNILIMTRWLPFPPISGNPIRNYNLFKRVGQVHNLWFLSYADPCKEQAAILHVEKEIGPVTVIPEKKHRGLSRPLQLAEYLLNGIPPDLRFYQDDESLEALHHLLNTVSFDLVQIEDSFLALFWDHLPPDLQSRSILTFHDVAFKKYQRMYPLEPSLLRKLRLWLHSKMMHQWEPSFARHFSACITMSDRDREILLSENPELTIRTIPNGVDTKALVPLPRQASQRKRLIFVGNMSYRPNVDGAMYCIQEILPVVRRTYPETELWLVGVDPSEELLRSASPYIYITGRVEDVIPYYAQSDICVVPLRAGSGTRLKILESMALGRPVVTTSIGCEGLEVNDQNLVIVNEPVAFAHEILELLDNNARYTNLVEHARSLVEEKYDWDTIAKELLDLYNHVVADAGSHD